MIPDITRPLPTDRLLPWLLEELRHVPLADVVIINGTGSHRVNTPDELRDMVGPSVFERVRVVNHDSQDTSRLAPAGVGLDGRLVFMNRDYIDADRRIVLGFIEPHFMAGFSGGYKAVFPGVADIHSIMRYHNAQMIGRPEVHVGRAGGQPDPGAHPPRRRAGAGRLLHQRDVEPEPRHHAVLLRRRAGRRTMPGASTRARRRWWRASSGFRSS